MAKSSFGIYVMHYLVIASLGYMLKMYTQLPPLAIYAILLASVLLISPALNELISRIPFIRWCVLGINKRKRK
jgi:surface polysaccharide O-acyltransferase-like enzyme